ncbi:COQ9 family protein [Aquibaculum arenosum]|uniref:COQ9 family protein n=1 Tax=Aquibaculum arenosum TaxID=3032591 RepID=A0ABT5YK75_9PROT|nr:COQ9 family protein [Fodinicurvata sp. CAU 1616]MDF2095231.1 COQ9 family protein [Fodinicurvata sp. CAU 1616]
MDLEEQREALLQAALPHVVFDGWSEVTLRAACRDLGMGVEAAMSAFPGGPQDLVEAFSTWADREMLVRLADLPLEEMRVRERVSAGVRLRLEVLAPHREAVRRSLSFLALPQNATLGPRLLWRSADCLWYAAGDRATDYNHYSKRILLSGVLSTTTLYWLEDRSEDFADTHAFLERRIDEVLKVGGRFGKTMGRMLDLPDRLMQRRSRSPLRRRMRGLGVR